MVTSNTQTTLTMDTEDTSSIVSAQSKLIKATGEGSGKSKILCKRTMKEKGFLSGAEEKYKRKISIENRLTRISLGIVYLFIICHVWRLIPTAYEAFFSKDGTVISLWPRWLLHIYHLSHTLIVFNSAVNFMLYVIR